MAWNTVVMMNGPPLAPVTSSGRWSLSRTMVGVIADSMRLPGAMALASPWTRPYMFGVPGFAAKSSISLFRRNPPPVTVTADPYQPLRVVVRATAFPRLSATEKCVVCRLSPACRPARYLARRSGPVGGDRRAQPGAERRRQEFRLIELHVIRIPEHLVADRERAPHALGLQVHGLCRVPAQAGEIVLPELTGNQGERDAAGRGRWHRDHVVPAVLERDRRPPLRLIAFEVFRGDDALAALHLGDEQRRRSRPCRSRRGRARRCGAGCGRDPGS